MQAFMTPAYSESAANGISNFALAYAAQTTTVTRTELGAWLDDAILLNNGTLSALRTRAAWGHDNWSDLGVNAAFQSLPGSGFTVIGAAPLRNSLLASVGAEIDFQERFLRRMPARHRVRFERADLHRIRAGPLQLVTVVSYHRIRAITSTDGFEVKE